jgi:coenzyme F420-reducing hydrogenase beta subunit
MITIEQMIQEGKANCVGCYGCYNVCPKKAIVMEEDEEGFSYPVIQQKKCVQCEACSHVCPVIHPITDANGQTPDTYAAINEDWDIRRESSSGGIFYLLANDVLKQGGIVFGAGFDTQWEVVHQVAENKKALAKLRMSKYVQSRIEDTYYQVKQNLELGRQVLFVGTPCQCVALKRYLNKEYDNLVLVDFICHGVPSPGVWRRYRNWRTKGKKITYISFRNKCLSWEKYLLSFFFKNDDKYQAEDLNHDLYLKGFLQNLYLRPSCHQCKFCHRHRPTDLTLADFWGVQNVLPEMYDGKGTSLVFVHSVKGKEIFESISAKKMKTDFDRAIQYNPSMVRPVIPSKNRQRFFEEFIAGKQSINQIIEENTKIPLIQQVRGILYRVLYHIPGVVWTYKKVRGK